MLIVCGSAISWMLSKVVHNKGGLYNRLTAQINLMPFTLAECAEYAASRGIVMNHHQLLECYMIMGGVPYYWSLPHKELSLSQNIDRIFFADDAPLRDEFRHLFRSLFKRSDSYVAIIETLGTRKAGMSRTELLKATGQTNSGGFTSRLEDLGQCGFIRRSSPPEVLSRKRRDDAKKHLKLGDLGCHFATRATQYSRLRR